MRRNVIIFGGDMRSSVHGDNKGKDFLILGEGTTQDSVQSKRLWKKKDHGMCLGNISKEFTIYNMKKTELLGVVNFFSVILILLILTIF